jgi:hypothetical protein
MNKTIVWIAFAVCTCASLFAPCAYADIYKCVGEGGTPTFVGSNTKSNYKDCQVIMRENDQVVVTSPKKTASPSDSTKPNDFPKVDKQTQNQRDGKRKEILLSELSAEQKALETAKNQGDSSNINLHQQNIQLLQKEVSALK